MNRKKKKFPRGGDVVMTDMRTILFGIAAKIAGRMAAPYLLPARSQSADVPYLLGRDNYR